MFLGKENNATEWLQPLSIKIQDWDYANSRIQIAQIQVCVSHVNNLDCK